MTMTAPEPTAVTVFGIRFHLDSTGIVADCEHDRSYAVDLAAISALGYVAGGDGDLLDRGCAALGLGPEDRAVVSRVALDQARNLVSDLDPEDWSAIAEVGAEAVDRLYDLTGRVFYVEESCLWIARGDQD